MVSERVIALAVSTVVATADPRRVVLFGSHARGQAGAESDADLLVILSAVRGRRAEMIRLRDAIRPRRIPVDIIVATEQEVLEWGELPGTVLYAALHEGRTLYEAA